MFNINFLVLFQTHVHRVSKLTDPYVDGVFLLTLDCKYMYMFFTE